MKKIFAILLTLLLFLPQAARAEWTYGFNGGQSFSGSKTLTSTSPTVNLIDAATVALPPASSCPGKPFIFETTTATTSTINTTGDVIQQSGGTVTTVSLTTIAATLGIISNGTKWTRLGFAGGAGSIPLTNIAQGGATNGQPLVWNGTQYAPSSAAAFEINPINTPGNFPIWLEAVSKVLHGVSDAEVCIIGDSTTQGLYLADNTIESFPSRLIQMLNQHVPTAEGMAHPDFGNNRWNMPQSGGWWLNFPGYTIRGQTSCPAMTFRPGYAFDSVTIYHQRYGPLNETNTVSVDGVTVGTFNTNGGNDIPGTTVVSDTFPCPTHTGSVISVLPDPAGSYLIVTGIETHDSQRTAIKITNEGKNGFRSIDWTTSSPSYIAPVDTEITAIAPVLSVIDLSINDASGQGGQTTPTSNSDFQTNMQTLISLCKASGDISMCSSIPWEDTQLAGTVARQQGLISIIRAMAVSNNGGFIDKFDRWPSYANSLYWRYNGADPHPNYFGNWDLATCVMNGIMTGAMIKTDSGYVANTTKVPGTSGNIAWSVNGKKLVLNFNNYTNTNPVTINFPVSFSSPPAIVYDTSSLAITSITDVTTDHVTIPACSAIVGNIIIEGFALVPAQNSPNLFLPALSTIAPGSLINLVSSSGVLKMQPADNSTGLQADGFCTVGCAPGASAPVVLGTGTDTGVSGLTIGSRYYLGTAGGVTSTAPTTTGYLKQPVGIARTATELEYVQYPATVLP